MSISSIRPSTSIPAMPSTSSSSAAATSAPSSSGGSSWLETGMQMVGGVLGGGSTDGASGSKEDQTKAMIDSFIFANLQKMRDESEKKLEEAMKKRS